MPKNQPYSEAEPEGHILLKGTHTYKYITLQHISVVFQRTVAAPYIIDKSCNFYSFEKDKEQFNHISCSSKKSNMPAKIVHFS